MNNALFIKEIARKRNGNAFVFVVAILFFTFSFPVILQHGSALATSLIFGGLVAVLMVQSFREMRFWHKRIDHIKQHAYQITSDAKLFKRLKLLRDIRLAAIIGWVVSYIYSMHELFDRIPAASKADIRSYIEDSVPPTMLVLTVVLGLSVLVHRLSKPILEEAKKI